MVAHKLNTMRQLFDLLVPRAGAFALTWLCSSCVLLAGPHIDIVVGPDAPKLERFAAEELAAQLTRLYGAEAAVVEKAPQDDAPLVLVGSPATNPAVKQAAGENWPKLSDQGHLLRSVKLDDRDALLVGGGSPRATLWAAYELGHRLGVRYLLSGDVYPAEPGELKLSGYDVLLEPSLKDRTWIGMGAEPIGLSAWGLEDQKRLLGQLAKLKFNRVVLRFEPWQPFVDFECHGVHKRTAQLWQRETWPIDSETPGRAAFHGVKEFSNPDFAGNSDYEAKTKAGIALACGVLERARELGMATGIAVSPFAFPREFAETFASRPLESIDGRLSIDRKRPPPSAGLAVCFKQSGQLAKDASGQKLVDAQLAAYLKSYPDIDAVHLARLRGEAGLESSDAPWFSDLHLLFDSKTEQLRAANDMGIESFLWHRPNIWNSVKLRWGGTIRDVYGTVFSVESNRDPRLRGSQILPLIGEPPRMLPQGCLGELHAILNRIRGSDPIRVEANFGGFAVECGMPGDLDLNIFYLARTAFDAELTPEAACEELVAPICGSATSERLLLGFRAVERATALADEHDPLFGTPSPDVVMKHYTSDSAAPAWWKEAKEGYLACMTESLRANDRSLLPGRPWLRHVSKRMEFGYEYISAIEQAQLAGAAKSSGDSEAQLTHLEAAVEAMYNALHALGEVAADPSDRGVIAVLAEYGYRPLVAEFEKVQDAADE